jgi:hypothetical protein
MIFVIYSLGSTIASQCQKKSSVQVHPLFPDPCTHQEQMENRWDVRMTNKNIRDDVVFNFLYYCAATLPACIQYE